MCPISGEGARSRLGPDADGARKRVATETFRRHEAALLGTARRYSLCTEDAEDALQRGFEILLRKAPTDNPRELVRWTQTVVKHEALAVRRERERALGALATGAEAERDWISQIPAHGDGPPELAERREAIARSREALQALKPQERRALALLGEGYSYAEIGEITGFSRTKINRCLAEGRERFRGILAGSEDGSRCAEMRPLISAFCDGEAGEEETATLREHLRACSGCRATVRTYRAAPAAAAALVPALPLGRSLLGRAHDAIAALSGRFGGGAAESSLPQVAAAGGSRGAGTIALAKLLALCVGTAGGAAVCAATGVIPVPFTAEHQRSETPKLEWEIGAEAPAETSDSAVAYETEPEPVPPPRPESAREEPPSPDPDPAPAPAAASGSVEYAPPPPESTAAPPASAESAADDPAGEFGP